MKLRGGSFVVFFFFFVQWKKRDPFVFRFWFVFGCMGGYEKKLNMNEHWDGGGGGGGGFGNMLGGG
jgi:hypothetical protein